MEMLRMNLRQPEAFFSNILSLCALQVSETLHYLTRSCFTDGGEARYRLNELQQLCLMLQLDLLQALIIIRLTDNSQISAFFTCYSRFSFAVFVGQGVLSEALALMERSYVLKDCFGGL
jgi:hypothetical protein